MLIIYTGDGKGKTSAAVGQAMRALGQGLRVAFGQFMKRSGQAGEQKTLATLLGDGYTARGKGFLRRDEDRPAHREAALELLAWAEARLAEPAPEGGAMLLLDETLYALGAGILERAEVEAIIDHAAASGWHLVLTGRGLTDWLAARADLVTEMVPVKHPYASGVTAQPGIEY
ncbi:MAG: cob(I)yrinic acid a,c-diamide adenosyltransferase [Desulfovibrionaceae bacterium]